MKTIIYTSSITSKKTRVYDSELLYSAMLIITEINLFEIVTDPLMCTLIMKLSQVSSTYQNEIVALFAIFRV